MRYFVEIAYKGKNYHGWQIQPDSITVQEALEGALSMLLRKKMEVTGAGRTDAGVHARQLFAHFDSEELLDVNDFIYRLNSFLPKDISVINIFPVKDDTHARFHAILREYQYHIVLKKNPFLEDYAYFLHQKPDVNLMNEASKILLDYKDFQCFSRSKTDVKTYHCKIKKAYWEERDEQLIFTISADRFLRNMVRAIVGTLLDVGAGKTSLSNFHDIIKSKDRSKAGTSAPAHGLFLTKVEYPQDIYID